MTDTSGGRLRGPEEISMAGCVSRISSLASGYPLAQRAGREDRFRILELLAALSMNRHHSERGLLMDGREKPKPERRIRFWRGTGVCHEHAEMLQSTLGSALRDWAR